MSTLPERIRAILQTRGWSQRELSRRAALTETAVGTLLAALDKDPEAITLTTARKLAAGAEVSLDWLLTGRDEFAEESFKAPTLGSRPDWPRLLADAQELQRAPAWVWARVAISKPVVRDEELTAGAVADVAALILRHGKPAQH